MTLDAGDFHIARTGEGPPILFLHGFPQCWYEWRHQLAEFGRDHLAVASDLRGYNTSPKPDGVAAYAVGPVVDDVRQLADKLGFDRFVLVGHDWGAVVAWAFAAMHPQRLEGLVIIDGPHPALFDRALRADPATQEALRFYGVYRSPRAEEILSRDDFAHLASSFGGVLSDDDVAVYKDSWRQPGALTGMLNYYRAADTGPPDPDRGRPEGRFVSGFTPEQLTIPVPTLVVWGEKSILPLSVLDGLDAYVPDLSVVTVPGAGHWVAEERPGEVNAHVRRFLSG